MKTKEELKQLATVCFIYAGFLILVLCIGTYVDNARRSSETDRSMFRNRGSIPMVNVWI